MIARVYDLPLEVERMPDANQVVDDILGQHDYLFPMLDSGGGLEPHSVDAVPTVRGGRS